jgi:acyl-CoA thioesterase I
MSSVLDCNTPLKLCRLGQPLPNFAKVVRNLDAINIVAIGSSSTAGDGASSPSSSYPSRLGAALASHFSEQRIFVLNLGVGGQEAPDEAARFKNDVLAKDPSLVIWQVGTNAAWKDYFLDDVEAGIFRGLEHLRGTRADVIFMDLQYAPALLDKNGLPKPATGEMLDLIAGAAAKSATGLFRRFEIMKFWHDEAHIPFEYTISNFDGNWLHQNDWSYTASRRLCAAAS